MFPLNVGRYAAYVSALTRTGEGTARMPNWARMFVLIVGMLAWVGIVIVSLRLEQIPSAMVIGFPAALWLALAGGRTIAARRDQQDEPAAGDEVATPDEEGGPA